MDILVENMERVFTIYAYIKISISRYLSNLTLMQYFTIYIVNKRRIYKS